MHEGKTKTKTKNENDYFTSLETIEHSWMTKRRNRRDPAKKIEKLRNNVKQKKKHRNYLNISKIIYLGYLNVPNWLLKVIRPLLEHLRWLPMVSTLRPRSCFHWLVKLLFVVIFADFLGVKN